jgi:hypothetical protein
MMAMAATEMEQRLLQLEKSFSERIARLEEQISRLTQAAPGTTLGQGAAWWKQIVGVFQDDPEFEDAMRLGRAYREALRPEPGELPTSPLPADRAGQSHRRGNRHR